MKKEIIEYAIPSGYEAEITDGKVILKKLNPDTITEKTLIEYLTSKAEGKDVIVEVEKYTHWLSWLNRRALRNGVYIVYKDGRYAPFTSNLPKEEGMRVGIYWNGHSWLIGTDYGEQPWTKASNNELERNSQGIKEEWEALFDWDYIKTRAECIDLWKHIPFKDDETMPTAPMVLVQEKLAREDCLNAALSFCDLPEYETSTYRWFAQRYNAYYAWLFYGYYGILDLNPVVNAYRCQAVALWDIE